MFELTPYVRRHNPAYYDPFKDMENMERAFFRENGSSEFKTDIVDAGDHFELEAELPGFKKEDIKVDLDQNYLTISAERNESKEEKDKKGNYVRRERYYGSYSRSFDVTGIDTEKIGAAYENGMLKLTLPKKEAEKPQSHRLEIQ